MITLFKTDGTTQETKPAEGEVFSHEELMEMVGGYVEYVLVSREGANVTVAVVNEDGRLKGLPHNVAASFVAGTPLVGNVLICPANCLG